MIVRTKEDLKGTKGEIGPGIGLVTDSCISKDGMGVTLTDAILSPGLDEVFWYKNHFEAVYCIDGEGTLEDLGTGRVT